MILELLSLAAIGAASYGWYQPKPKVRVEPTPEPPPENEFAEWDAQHETSLKERDLIIGYDGKTRKRSDCQCGRCGPGKWYCT